MTVSEVQNRDEDRRDMSGWTRLRWEETWPSCILVYREQTVLAKSNNSVSAITEEQPCMPSLDCYSEGKASGAARTTSSACGALSDGAVY